MENDTWRVGRLELLDDWTWAVSRSLDDADALLNDDAGVCWVVRRLEGWEECDVDAERLVGHGSASSNLLAQILWCRLSECCKLGRMSVTCLPTPTEATAYYAQSTSVADRTCEFSVSNPLHATLYYRYCTQMSASFTSHFAAMIQAYS